MQGSRIEACYKIPREIWEWCIPKGLFVTATYILGANNVEADTESRTYHDNSEWWGTPDIDLFASKANHKTPVFCSWKPDADAQIIDAFTISWSR